METRDRAAGTRLRGLRRIGHRRVAEALVVVVVLGAVAAGLFIRQGQHEREATIIQRFNTRHVTATRFLEASVRQIEAHQITLAKQSLSAPVVSPAAFATLTRTNLLDAAALYDGDGRSLAYAASTPSAGNGIAAFEREQAAAIESALNGVPAVDTSRIEMPAGDTGLGEDDVVRRTMIAFAVPYQTASGPRVFAGRFPQEDSLLQSFVANALSSFRTTHVYLVDERDTVIVADRRDSSGMSLDDVAPWLATRREVQGFSADGSRYFVSGPVRGTRWRLLFSLDADELFLTLNRGTLFGPWAALAVFVTMGFGIVVLLSRALAAGARAEKAHARQRAILDAAGDAFVGMDAQGCVTDWNSAAGELFGWSRAEATGRPVAELIIPVQDRDRHADGLRAFLDTGVTRLPSHSFTMSAQHRDGHRIPVELTVGRTRWQGSWRFHAFLRDITERLEQERLLQDMALTDSLTGLANRRAFLEQLDQAHARATRRDSHLAVLYADVDRFKSINDTYGHAAGDTVLCAVADRLRSHFRTEDTVGRLGGDEFAVICENYNRESHNLLERLRRVLSEPYEFRGQRIDATVSVGMASPESGEGPSHLLERADRRMYRAKATTHP